MDFSEIIGIGLTSSLVRSITESVQTTLFVQVAKGSELILSRTYSVRLLPIDEWQDDEANRIWLPSFVLPRDPAVLEILTRAQHYLIALRDDPTAGFDGYQSNDGKCLDSQVQAIWYALLHDYSLRYINPPPTFTTSSQRLRTPTAVLRGQRGTCIDLALLLAACLEFVDIKAVIFTQEDHAFAGYWRSDTDRTNFLVRADPGLLMPDDDNLTPLPDNAQMNEDPTAFAQVYPWQFDKSRYHEVREVINKGQLIPIETTSITTRDSFTIALAQGRRKFEASTRFESMLDIQMARDNDITPLPFEYNPGWEHTR